MRNSFFGGTLAIVLGLWLPVVETHAQEKSASAKFVPGDAFFAITARPAQVASYIDSEAEENQELGSNIETLTGLQVKNIREISISFGYDADIDDEGQAVSVRFKFKKDVDARKLAERWFSDTGYEDRKLGKTSILAPEENDQGMPCLYAPDKRTLVMAALPRMKSIVAARRTSAFATKLMSQIDESDDLAVTFDLAEKRDQKMKLLRVLVPQMFVAAEDAESVFNAIQAGQLHVQLSEKRSVILSLKATDKDGADMLSKQLTDVAALAAGQLNMLRGPAQALAPDDAAVAIKMIDLVAGGLENFGVTISGTTVRGEIQTDEDMRELVNGIAQAARMWMSGTGAETEPID